LLGFASYFAGCVALCIVFGAVYLRLTPHRELDLIVRDHNASAAIALGGSVVGFAIALAGAVRETHSALAFLIWAAIALLAQVIGYGLARAVHPNLSRAIESNALAAAIWQASVSISVGLIAAACMSP
jgi:putative membrane protein